MYGLSNMITFSNLTARINSTINPEQPLATKWSPWVCLLWCGWEICSISHILLSNITHWILFNGNFYRQTYPTSELIYIRSTELMHVRIQCSTNNMIININYSRLKRTHKYHLASTIIPCNYPTQTNPSNEPK